MVRILVERRLLLDNGLRLPTDPTRPEHTGIPLPVSEKMSHALPDDPRSMPRGEDRARAAVLRLLLVLCLLPRLLTPAGADSLDEARELAELGQPARALTWLEDHPELAKEPGGLELRARCHFELGELDRAEELLRQLVELPELPATERARHRLRLARTLARRESLEEAARLAAEVLEEFPGPEARETAGFIFLKAHRYEEALPPLEQWARAHPSPRSHLAVGIARARLGQVAAARDALLRALEDPATRQEARFELGLLLGGSGEPARALEFLLDAIEEDPHEPRLIFQASRQLLRSGNPRLAARGMRFFEKLREVLGESSRHLHLEAAGRSLEATLLRASRHERLGEIDTALRLLDRRLRLAPSPELRLARASFWMRRGLLAEALTELEILEDVSLDDTLESRVREIRSEVESLREEITGWRKRIGEVRWSDAAPILEEALDEARESEEVGVAESLARTLLARDPRSGIALEILVERTRAPEAFPLHLHYLARLRQALPDDARILLRHRRLREALRGQPSSR